MTLSEDAVRDQQAPPAASGPEGFRMIAPEAGMTLEIAAEFPMPDEIEAANKRSWRCP